MADRISAEQAASAWAEAISERVDEPFVSAIMPQLVRVALPLFAGEPPRASWVGEAREWAYFGLQLLGRGLVSGPDLADGPVFALLLPRMANHLADLKPLAAALEARGHRAVVAFPSVYAGERAPDSVALVDPRQAEMAGHVARLAPDLARLAVAIETSRPAGISRAGALKLAGEVVRTSLLPYVRYRDAVERALDMMRPRVVVVGNPNVIEGRVAIDLTRERAIPSVALQHGSVTADDPAWRSCRVDRFFAWGARAKADLVRAGLSEERVDVVGCPRLDEVFRTRSSRVGAAKRVLVASSGAGHQVGLEEHLAFIDEVYRTATVMSGLEWVIKLHPKDEIRHYQAAAARHPNAKLKIVPAVRAKHGTDIFEWLEGTLALVTVVSSSALDAIATGVPVISLQARGTRGNQSFLEAAEVVTDAHRLEKALRAIEAGPLAKHLLEKAHELRDALFANREQAASAAAERCSALAQSP